MMEFNKDMSDFPNLPKRPIVFEDEDDDLTLNFKPTDGKAAVIRPDADIISEEAEEVLDDVASEEEITEEVIEEFETVVEASDDVVVIQQDVLLKTNFSSKKAVTPPKVNKNVPDNIEVEDWTDDTSTDPTIGLGSENDIGIKRATRIGKGFAITERDILIMRFLTRYRYAYVDQIARLVNAEVKDVKARLRRLENEGLIRSEDITAGQSIFLTRKAGLSIIDMDFPEIKKGSVSFITVAHTVGLVNLAVELEMATGGKNILGEEEFPQFNRWPRGIINLSEPPSLIGETTITEREIRRGNKLYRGDKTTEDMRIIAKEMASDSSAPELLEGNEGFFAVYGTGKDGEHVPDLVVVRPRGGRGEVKHIAIELELTPKNNSEWSRILRWYRDHGFMYEKIYYFTHKRTIADNLRKIASDLGLEDKIYIRKYIPQNNRGPFWG